MNKTQLHEKVDAEYSPLLKWAASVNPAMTLSIARLWAQEKEHIERYEEQSPVLKNISMPAL